MTKAELLKKIKDKFGHFSYNCNSIHREDFYEIFDDVSTSINELLDSIEGDIINREDCPVGNHGGDECCLEGYDGKFDKWIKQILNKYRV